MTEEHNFAFINYHHHSHLYNTHKKLEMKWHIEELENIIWTNSELIIGEGSEEPEPEPVLLTLNEDSVLNLQSNVSHHHEERVFSIVHLLELILSLLDGKSLMDCRLVCSSWAFFGSKELQKRITIKLTDPVWVRVMDDKNNNNPKNTDTPSSRHASIRRLASVMRTSYEFPCSSFQFDISGANQRFVESFLDEHGPSVNKLNLHARLTLKYLRTLLFRRLPNLEHFSLSTQQGSDTEHLAVRSLARTLNSGKFGQYRVRSSESRTYSAGAGASILQTFGPQDEASITQCNSDPLFKYPLKLKTVQIDDFYTIPFFENVLPIILKHSRNLTQVQIPSCVYPLLLPPNVNRLNLLRKLELSLSNTSVDLLQALAVHNQGSLSLVKELSFAEFPLDLVEGSSDLVNFPELWSVAERSISGILEVVSDSCERLTLPQLGYLKQIVFPVMPRLEQIRLDRGPRYPHHSSQFFPSEDETEFLFTTKFPNLNIVSICCSIFLRIRMSDLLGNLEPVPIRSVEQVSLEGMLASRVTREMINHTQWELQQIFQNALIWDNTIAPPPPTFFSARQLYNVHA